MTLEPKNGHSYILNNEVKTMICDACENCDNLHVSELGCFGSDKPCEYFHSADYDENFRLFEFEINMSRNKFIRFLHEKSRLSYSELRTILKKNKWNMSDTYIEVFLFF